MKWTSVKDKLPEHSEYVLVRNDKDENIVCIFIEIKKMNEFLISKGIDRSEENIKKYSCGYCFSSQESPGRVFSGVTHWMRVPELNKTDGDKSG